MLKKSESELIAALCQKNSDAFSDAIVELAILAREDPEATWRTILSILGKNPPEVVVGQIAAGPLEDLLDIHGREFIDRVELECRSNPELAKLLSGIYRGDIDDDIWA